MDARALSKRHYTDHPMAKFTDDELHALNTLSEKSNLFRSELADHLDALGWLAFQEANDRDFRRSTETPPPPKED